MSGGIRKLLAGAYYAMVCYYFVTSHFNHYLGKEVSACQGLPNALRKTVRKKKSTLNSHLQMHFPSQFLILLLRDMSETHKYLVMSIIYSALGKWCYLYLYGDNHFIQVKCHCTCIVFQVIICFLLLFPVRRPMSMGFIWSPRDLVLYTAVLQFIMAQMKKSGRLKLNGVLKTWKIDPRPFEINGNVSVVNNRFQIKP